MSYRDEAIQILKTEEKFEFLALLWHNLTVSARGGYAEVGTAPETGQRWMRCINEVQHKASQYMFHDLDGTQWHSPERLVDALFTAALIFGGCDSGLGTDMRRTVHYFLRRGLKRSFPQSPQHKMRHGDHDHDLTRLR
jgi:hypothetical protein